MGNDLLVTPKLQDPDQPTIFVWIRIRSGPACGKIQRCVYNKTRAKIIGMTALLRNRHQGAFRQRFGM